MEQSLFNLMIDRIASFTDMRGRPDEHDISEAQFMSSLDKTTESQLIWHYMGLPASEFDRIPVGVHMWLLDLVMSERHRHVIVGSISMSNYVNLYLEQGFGIARHNIAMALFALSQERDSSYAQPLFDRIFDDRIRDKSYLVYELITLMMDFTVKHCVYNDVQPDAIIDLTALKVAISGARVKSDVKDLWEKEIRSRLMTV